jgi:hypothetical protein
LPCDQHSTLPLPAPTSRGGYSEGRSFLQLTSSIPWCCATL